jgi:thiamine-phosphate pyrophosphorylase
MKRGICGLYAVTPDEPDTATLAAKVRSAVIGGAVLVQYRHKSADGVLRREQASALLKICREHRIPLVVNDDLTLALEIGADGVHLGAGDGSIASARAALGPDGILGASCYDLLQNGLDAERTGATYVAFGSFFPSSVKPNATRASVELLREAKRRLSVPVVAIGGITQANAAELIAAGADSLAVISALFAAPDVTRAARQFRHLFDT